MKKILIIAGQLRIGGAEKVARDIAVYGDRTKYEYHYIVFGDRTGEYESQLKELGCKIFHFPEPSESYWQYWKNMRSALKNNRYDVIHVHTMFNCGWSVLFGKLAQIPVRISHSHSALQDHKSLTKWVYESIMRMLILSCSTHLVACGTAAGNRLYGEKAFQKKGLLIQNGIDTAVFRYSEARRAAIRQRLGLEGRFLLGHVGHLAEVKNQSFLLELMPLILEKRPDAMLLLLGEGEDRPVLERKIRELHLENNVIMTGNVTNVADYLSAMDVFVFPSLYEGLPLSILEVQANGLPCVISDSVPDDVFLTDLIHPLSLSAPKHKWIDAILSLQREDPHRYNEQLKGSDYAVETAMAKIYRIYEKET